MRSFVSLVLLVNVLFANICFAVNVNIDFFKKFNDEYLIKYILETLENNHNLKEASYRVEQYRYEIKTQFSQELPQLSVGSAYLGAHFPKTDNSDFFFVRPNAYILPFRVNYEPDFLLKSHDKTKSKEKLYKAQLANQKSTYISLLSDVASAYFNVLLTDYLIKTQFEILKNKTKNLDLTNKKYKNGVISLLELNEYKKKLQNEQIYYDTLVKNQKTILYNLASLIGKSPDCINEIKRGKIEEIEYIENIPQIINSDLIYNRPDLIEIENKLKSAKIDITVAKKEFFPSFNINGLYSMDTATGGNFFSWNSAFALLIAGLTQDIFKGGYKIANLKIKKAKYGELFEQYKQADLNAIKEINNALNIIKQDLKNEKSTLYKLNLQDSNFNFSEKKLKQGTISKIEYLDEKSALDNSKQLWASSKATRLMDYVTLYKSLGGEL